MSLWHNNNLHPARISAVGERRNRNWTLFHFTEKQHFLSESIYIKLCGYIVGGGENPNSHCLVKWVCSVGEMSPYMLPVSCTLQPERQRGWKCIISLFAATQIKYETISHAYYCTLKTRTRVQLCYLLDWSCELPPHSPWCDSQWHVWLRPGWWPHVYWLMQCQTQSHPSPFCTAEWLQCPHHLKTDKA